MIKLGICGVGGRMGAAILRQALENKEIKVAGLLERPDSPVVGKKMADVVVSGDIREVLKAVDVLIDFTSPEATLKNAAEAAAAGKSLVVGTTGIVGDLREKLVGAVKNIPVVFSPNMSLSANVLFSFVEEMARLLPDYDAEITEIHHNLKKDSPSGTAQRLADAVAKGRGKKDGFVYGRHGQVGERKASEIGVHALRGGDVVGDHTVFFLGQGERVELVHRVTSRDAFAHGAVVAAQWLAGKSAGLYDMRDVLGLNKK